MNKYSQFSKAEEARQALFESNKEKSLAARASITSKLELNDYTDKEVEAMGGQVSFYNLKEPMTWDEFKELSEELKVSYIKAMANNYKGLTVTAMAEMFGKDRTSIRPYFNKAGIVSKQGPSHFEDKEKFEKDILSKVVAQEVIVPVPVTKKQSTRIQVRSASIDCNANEINSILKTMGLVGYVHLEVEVLEGKQ